jgi:hypothetical protein
VSLHIYHAALRRFYARGDLLAPENPGDSFRLV